MADLNECADVLVRHATLLLERLTVRGIASLPDGTDVRLCMRIVRNPERQLAFVEVRGRPVEGVCVQTVSDGYVTSVQVRPIMLAWPDWQAARDAERAVGTP